MHQRISERIMMRITRAPSTPPAIFGMEGPDEVDEGVEVGEVVLERGLVLKGGLGVTLKMS